MATFQLELSSLPSVSFEKIDLLPECSGIYFVVDSLSRVVYIGQAENIFKRWKTQHHRKYQIQQIHQENPVKIAWLVWNQEDLKVAENYWINFYHPLLNGTQVKTEKTIPSEVILRELLEQIRRLIVVIGIQKATKSQLPTVYLKYNYENSGKNGCAKTIKNFQKENKDRATNLKIKRNSYGKYIVGYNMRPGSREHKTVSRIQSSYNNHWVLACNGVIIDITPSNEQDFKFLREQDNSTWRKLAGIKVRAVNNPRDDYLNLVPMIDDPIPLLWTGKINL
jgi:GIY-YIG catalytic domain